MSEKDPPPEALDKLISLFNQGKHEEAAEQARVLAGSFPVSGQVWLVLGAALEAQGKDSLFALRKAVRLLPEHAEAHFTLGSAEQRLGHIEKALEQFRLATVCDPDSISAHYNMGVCLHSLNRLEEAIPAYRRVLELRPESTGTLNNLAMVYRELNRLDEAIECYLETLKHDSRDLQANLMLQTIYMDQKRLIEAADLCRQTLKAHPDFPEVRQALARILAYLSDYEQVVSESNAAFALDPNQAVMWEQRLYAFSYHSDLTAEEIFREFARWGDRFPEPETDFSAHDRQRGRRLRVGYVSPDFRRHTSRFYFWPLFSNHDRGAFELFAYSNVQKEDSATRLFKGVFEHWRDIRGVSDREVARIIQEDGIDILVDGCNHMLDDRLGVFALKPAPIQVTWLGAAWTTGLKAVDYVLFDPHIAPEGTLAREQIVRLPETFIAFQPLDPTPDVAQAPCLANGFITFGYTGRTERLNHRTFRLWGQILKRLPEARLILDFGPFAEPKTQAYYQAFLARHGVDMDRVSMRKSANIFEGLGDIDILLDSFPHSGGTMLLDALWMGVPALTLAGRPPLGRIGTSFMTNLGLPDWIASSEADYLEKACAFASQPRLLNELRLGMRERMQNSPLMDGPGFASNVEAAYAAMFDRWALGVATPSEPSGDLGSSV